MQEQIYEEVHPLAIAGVIAEFNPFHNGHQYLLQCAAETGDAVFCVMSGNVVQRGSLALYSERVRTRAALLGGADLVVQLPVDWSMAGAEQFALGGVALLQNLGVTDLFAGVDQVEDTLIRAVAEFLLSETYQHRLRRSMTPEKTAAMVRSRLIAEQFGVAETLFKDGNNTLAVEYAKACIRLNYTPGFHWIQRREATHNSDRPGEHICSASYLRERFLCTGDYATYVPGYAENLYQTAPHTDEARLYTTLLFVLKQCTLAQLQTLPDCSEGLHNRLYRAIQDAADYEELWCSIRTKRYPDARLRRLLWSAVLGLDNTLTGTIPPYRRVLGCSQNGRNRLSALPERNDMPLLINGKDYSMMNERAEKVLSHQHRADQLFDLALTKPQGCTPASRYKLILSENG